MQSSDESNERGAPSPATILSIVVGIGIVAAVRYPAFDDEAHAIANASQGLTEILSRGLGRSGQFHPPLAEVVLHAWLKLAGTHRLCVIRAPAILCWLCALASFYWALRPIASKRARRMALTLVALWPAHLLLPFAATWYSMAALLGAVAFGALVRALSAVTAREMTRALLLAIVATAALAYTVFAWPFVLAGELAGAVLLCGFAVVRRHIRVWIASAVVLAAVAAPTALAIGPRIGPMIRRGAGGGPMQTAGAGLALLVGHSAPANGWIGLFALASLAAAFWAGKMRTARALLIAALLTFGCLAATNTLNDKRLLLASLFVPAALGLAASEPQRQLVLLLCTAAAIPAWLGWIGATSRPWLFPRWQDPVTEIVCLHFAAPPPRLLLTANPSVAFMAALASGEMEIWQAPTTDASHRESARWWAPARGTYLVDRIASRQRQGLPPFQEIDVVLSGSALEKATTAADVLEPAGWRVTEDLAFGQDSLAQLRHRQVSSARLRLIRFSRR
jgi:hypothetical protein